MLQSAVGEPMKCHPCSRGVGKVAILKPLHHVDLLLNEAMSQTGKKLTIVSRISTEWLCSSTSYLDYLVIDSDFFDVIDDVIDACRQVRDEAPELPIILISSDVQGDDFSSDRLWICDATLRKPFAEGRLKEAAASALENNTAFRQRMPKCPLMAPT